MVGYTSLIVGHIPLIVGYTQLIMCHVMAIIILYFDVGLLKVKDKNVC